MMVECVNGDWNWVRICYVPQKKGSLHANCDSTGTAKCEKTFI